MSTSTASLIFHEIEKNPKKSISFARYMELALYSEPHGYYTNRSMRPIGRTGDFYTSVSVGETFGMLLGIAADRLWRDTFDSIDGFCVVEQGAHNGQLARDFIKNRPLSEGGWRYVIIEPSDSARPVLTESLSGTDIEIVSSVSEIDAAHGLFLCNELVDALPVHRVRWDGSRWTELRVTSTDGGQSFESIEHEITNNRLIERLKLIGTEFPQGYSTEVNLSMESWIEETAALFSESGRFWIIDYGFGAEEYYKPSRTDGTIRSYDEHRAGDDPLQHEPGTVDITAHVDFTALARIAEMNGLKTTGPPRDQHDFLTHAAIPWLKEIEANGSAMSDPEIRAMVRQFTTLTHPGMMGRTFKVMELEKGKPSPPYI